MSDLISKEKIIKHLEAESGMNLPEWLRETIESAPAENVYIVGYQDAKEEPVNTLFDNREAAEKCFKVFAESHERAWLDHCPVYSQFLIMGEGEEE